MGKNSAIVNAAILPGMIVLGFLLATSITLPSKLLLVLSLSLSVASVLLLVIAKLPKLRQGVFLSVGVGRIAKQRLPYAIAYFLLGSAVVAWASLAFSLVD